jgi:hypothetical protein
MRSPAVCQSDLKIVTYKFRAHSNNKWKGVTFPISGRWIHNKTTRLFEMIVGVLTTCHTQYSWDSCICISLFNRATLQVFVTYLTGALYVHRLWFYKLQHDNPVRSKLSVACQPIHRCSNCWFKNSLTSENGNFLIHRCNYILLSQVYCVWPVVKTSTIISNNPVLLLQLPEYICRYTNIDKAIILCHVRCNNVRIDLLGSVVILDINNAQTYFIW